MDTSTPTTMSFTEKLTNIFVAPGELYENVRDTPKTTSNWLVPLILFIVVALLLGQLVLQNPAIVDEITRTMTQQFDKAIQEGKMTQEQADQMSERTKPGSMWFTILQIGGTVIITPIALFLLSLVYWLLGKWGMNATAPYMKVVEVAGLTMFITMPGEHRHHTPDVRHGFDLRHSQSGALVTDFDIQNKLHAALAKVNIFTIWDLAVVSIGLSKLFQRDLPKVLVLVFALWVVWSVFTVMTGMPADSAISAGCDTRNSWQEKKTAQGTTAAVRRGG